MRAVLVSMFAGLMLVATGCGPGWRTNTEVSYGKGLTKSAQYFGDLGVEGKGWDITIQRGSNVPKLTIRNDNNRINVEDGVSLYQIEFMGNGNIVTLPENHILVRVTNWGSNQVIRRPSATHDLPNAYTPPTYPSETAAPAPAPRSAAPTPRPQPESEVAPPPAMNGAEDVK